MCMHQQITGNTRWAITYNLPLIYIAMCPETDRVSFVIKSLKCYLYIDDIHNGYCAAKLLETLCSGEPIQENIKVLQTNTCMYTNISKIWRKGHEEINIMYHKVLLDRTIMRQIKWNCYVSG